MGFDSGLGFSSTFYFLVFLSFYLDFSLAFVFSFEDYLGLDCFF